MNTNAKLTAAMVLVVILAGLGGYNFRATRAVSEAPPKVKPSARPAPPAAENSGPVRTPAPAGPAKAEPSRADVTRGLRERGATVQLRLFGMSSLTSPTVAPKAKEFFQLTDEEEAKLQDAFTRRIKELEEVAFQNAQVRGNDGQKLLLTIPAEPGKAVMDQLGQDVAQIVGRERGAEFMEMGQEEFALLLRGGLGERNLEVTRQASPRQPDGLEGPPLYEIKEEIRKGMTLGGRFEPQKADGPYAWLSKFSGDLSVLATPGSPPAGSGR